MLRKWIFLLTLFASFVFSVAAPSAMDRAILWPKFYAEDGSGSPLAGGKVHTYESGTTTPKTTYTDRGLTTPNTNPVILDSRGEADIYCEGLLKVTLYDSNDVLIGTVDNIRASESYELSDNDNDTKLEVERTADDDTIRVKVAGQDQFNVVDGKIEPTTDNDVDGGSSTKRWKDWYLDGDLHTDGIIMRENAPPTTAANEGGLHANTLNSVTELFFERESAGASILLSLMENKRATFSYSDGDTILIDGGTYMLRGASYDVVTWNSQITFDLKSTGSNSASDDYGADGWHYIYIDDSAVTTQASPILDADCFLNETTAPSYNHTKKGWYNGSDLCIFAVYETGDALTKFFHVGDTVIFDDEIGIDASLTGNNYTSFTLGSAFRMPAFTTKAIATFRILTNGAVSPGVWLWAQNTSAANGHIIGDFYHNATQWQTTLSTDVIVDSSDKIAYKSNQNDANTLLTVYQNGWYFPTGM